MTAPFGPQLLGETEKTLKALLRRSLEGTGLDEELWVTLRVASEYDGPVGTLAAVVANRAQFTDTDRLVADLEQRGLIDGERPTSRAQTLLRDVLGGGAPIWDDLPEADAAARTLSTVLARARAVLAERGALAEV